MTGREVALRLANALVARACRPLPDGARDDRRREWEAELIAILDDPAIRSPVRRYARAVLFAAGQRRTVRHLARLTGARRLHAVAIRSAVAAAVAAVVLATTAVALSPVADHAEYDTSPAVAAEVYLALLAVVAGLACTALVTGLGLARITRWLRNRQRRSASTGGHGARGGQRSAGHQPRQVTGLAWHKARIASGATAVFVAAVVCFTAAIVVSQLSLAAATPSLAGSVLGFLALAAGVTGLACVLLLAVLAIAGTATWLRRLAHHTPRPPSSQANPAHQQPR